jgi:hypothetical protein
MKNALGGLIAKENRAIRFLAILYNPQPSNPIPCGYGIGKGIICQSLETRPGEENTKPAK